MFRRGIDRIEGNAPIKEQPQLRLHGMCTGFHHHKATLGNGFQLIRRHQWTLYHLQALAEIVLPLTDRAAEYRAAAEGFGKLLCRLAVGGKAAEDSVLTVVGEDLRALFSIVLLQLRQCLYDGHHGQPTGTACAEQWQDIEGGHGAQLITVKHHAAGQTPTVFVRHGEQLPRQRLYHQPCHEVFGGVLLRQDEEDSGLLRRELLGVDGTVKA